MDPRAVQQQQYEPIDHHMHTQMRQEHHYYRLEPYQQQEPQAFALKPSATNNPNEPLPSPQRSNMSSQPVTPQPSNSPRHQVQERQMNNNDDNSHATTSSPQVPPLESQNYTALVTRAPNYSTAILSDQNALIHETCPSFSSTKYNQNIYALDRQTIIDVQLHTKIDRGFFLADNDWTCYRRNYFQVSGSFSLDGIGMLYDGQDLPCMAKDDQSGQLEEIQYFMLGVRAKLSDCEKPVPLIQHTPKRDKGPQTTPMPRLIRPGGNLGFSAVGSSQSIVTFERLQFKTATANNGKRRAAQQYYVIIIELLAKLRNDNVITVAFAQSAPLVVRGRSPGHYAENDTGSRVSAPKRMTRGPHYANNNGGAGGPISASVHYNHPIAANPYQRNTNPLNNTNNDTNTSTTTSTTHAYGAQNAHPHMFPSNEYLYDYQTYNTAAPHYGHNYPPPTLPSMSHSSPYPLASAASIQQQQQHPQGHYIADDSGFHERVQSNTSSELTYHTSQNNVHSSTAAAAGDYSQPMKDHPLSDPYYWQRQQQQQQQGPPRHYQDHSRMRMTSNQSTTTATTSTMDHQQQSQQNSPYLHHQSQQPATHYYTQQHPAQSQQDHYQSAYTHSAGMTPSSANTYPSYEWRPPQQSTNYHYKMPMYTYGNNSDDARRFEYNSSERSTTAASFTNAHAAHPETTTTTTITTTAMSSPHLRNDNDSRGMSSPTAAIKAETTTVN